MQLKTHYSNITILFFMRAQERDLPYKKLPPLEFAATGDSHIDFIQFQDFDKSIFRIYFNDPNKLLSYLIDQYYQRTNCKQMAGPKEFLYFKQKQMKDDKNGNRQQGQVYDNNNKTIASVLKEFEQGKIEITNKESPSQNEMALLSAQQDQYNYSLGTGGKKVKLQIKGNIDDGHGDYIPTDILQFQVSDNHPVAHVKTLIKQKLNIDKQRIRIIKNGKIVANSITVKKMLSDDKNHKIQFFQEFKIRQGDFRLKVKFFEKEGEVIDITNLRKDDKLFQILSLSAKVLGKDQQQYKMSYRGQFLDPLKRLTDYKIQKNQLIQLYPSNQSIPQFQGEKQQVLITIKVSIKDFFKVPWKYLKNKTVKNFFQDFITGYRYKKSVNQNWCLKYGEMILNPEDQLNNLLKYVNPGITVQTIRNPRYFYFRRMGKYPQILKQYRKKLEQYALIKESNQRIRREVLPNYSQQLRRQLSNDQFLTPINVYTSGQYIKINEDLRNKKQDNDKPDISYCITHSLSKLPNLIKRVVHRGEFNFCYGRNHFLQTGKLVCFSSFFSASKSLNIAKSFVRMNPNDKIEQSKTVGTLFHILSLTGKQIQNFSRLGYQKEVLFSPHTYFFVDKILIHQNSVDEIWLTEVPTPSFQNKNIVLWVDDSPNNNTGVIENIYKEYQNIEILQVTSTRIAKLWMEQFNHLLQFLGFNLKVVSDMTRWQPISEEIVEDTYMLRSKQNSMAGAQLIRDFNNQYGYTTKILIFCGNIHNAIKQIKKLNIRDQKVWEVTVSQERVVQFCVSQCKRKSYGWCQIY